MNRHSTLKIYNYKALPLRFFLLVFLLLILIYRMIPLPEPLFKPDYSTVILDEHHRILRAFLNGDQQWIIPPQDTLKIPKKLETAVLTFEDHFFYYHPGVNPLALLRAFFQNITRDKVFSGASTLTMQVARLASPKPRTYLNKFLEILQALKLEIRHSKTDILKYYLNHAPYGGNIMGYQAASLRYFRKLPAALTWGESAMLAVLPNAPGLISPDQNPSRLKSKRDRLLKQLQQKHIIDPETCLSAMAEPLPPGSSPFEMRAAHLGQYLKDRHAPAGGLLVTRIHMPHQVRIEKTLNEHLRRLNAQGIYNGAVLVAETASGHIKAYAGSQDFFDAHHQGQVNGVLASRSSGSLLKPFLFARSIDAGIILPQTLLKDIPTFYGAFSPHNANNQYDGLVTARSALVRSLNVPAARLLNTYGLHAFYHFLKSAGVSTLFRFPDDYGLPIILGGAEVTLQDMAVLFRGLANRGRFSGLTVLKNPLSPPSGASSLLSPGSCFLTLNMLRELKRPGAEYYWEQYQNQWPLAWKTGTSYGQRDAWAVGVSPQWTIAVWVGNFSGEGNANLSGASCAGPILFDIFNHLPKDPQRAWFKKSDYPLMPLRLCSESGFLATDACPTPMIAEGPAEMKPLRRCPYHQYIFVDKTAAYRVNSLCWKAGEYQRVARLIFPPDVAQYVRSRRPILTPLPPWHPDCQGISEHSPLQILYPPENARLWLPRDFDGHQQRLTVRVAHQQHHSLIYWYLDNRFIGSTQHRHEKSLLLSKGWHTLEVVDEIGNRERRRFYSDMNAAQ